MSKWENGKGLPDTNSLPKLCEILGVSLNELLSGEKIVIENKNQKNEQLLLNIANWAMHRGTTRYLKCPNCNKCSWCKKVIK